MSRRYDVRWDERNITINDERASPVARFIIVSGAVALGTVVVWTALHVILPILGFTVSIVFGVLFALLGALVAIVFALPWVVGILAAIGVLKWLVSR